MRPQSRDIHIYDVGDDHQREELREEGRSAHVACQYLPRATLTKDTQKRKGAVTRRAKRDHFPSRSDSSNSTLAPLNFESHIVETSREKVNM